MLASASSGCVGKGPDTAGIKIMKHLFNFRQTSSQYSFSQYIHTNATTAWTHRDVSYPGRSYFQTAGETPSLQCLKSVPLLCRLTVQCRVFVICWFPCRSVLIVALLCVWPSLSTSLSPCYSVLFCIVLICIHPCPLALSCCSFCKVVTEFLSQSGSSCGWDRTHPGASTPY